MDFALTPDQQLFRREIVELARRRLNHGVHERDERRELDREGFLAIAEMGILAMPLPERYGGLGLDVTSCVVAMEALGYAAEDQGLAFVVNTQLWTCELPILHFGTEAQKDTWLPRLARGEVIGGHATTEPGAGSDAMSLATRAELRGDRWVLNGTKTFITNAPIADVLIVFASTGEQKRGFGGGLTAFLVPTDRAGVSVGKPLKKLGLRTAPMAEVTFEDVELDPSEMLGKKGGGAAIFSSEMEWERSCLFACHLGAMERQLERCVTYAQERTQFGQAIGRFQAISHRIANMKVRVELGRQMLYKVAWLKDRGERAVLEAAIAKLYVSEAYVQSSLDAVAIHGGYGYMAEYDVERMLRDSIGSVLYSGTSDIQRNLIARWLGL
ncbi:acyl-CoA dehydrogenase family protein [Myxococcota bacterium]|nr:acyl-CoA dehydrogenase family protein [Myxococcota bacterium]